MNEFLKRNSQARLDSIDKRSKYKKQIVFDSSKNITVAGWIMYGYVLTRKLKRP